MKIKKRYLYKPLPFQMSFGNALRTDFQVVLLCKRFGIVAAKIGEKIVAPMEYNGAMDSVLFESRFEKCFLPVIKKGTVIVMDNASFHRKKTA